MPKTTYSGETEYPDISCQISMQSYKEPSGILTKKLRSLLETAFGESEVRITETTISAKKIGKLNLTRVVFTAEVYYPKE